MKKYKVLTKDLKSPFKGFQFELNKKYVCEDFDESDKECSKGFYATDVEGILYSLNRKKDSRVFEVEVGGKSKVFDQFKQRFEKLTFIREIPQDELDKLLRAEDEKLDYNFYEACFPFNPLFGEPKEVTEKVKQLIDEWISVFDSVIDSVSDSVYYSVWYSVSNSVFNSVSDSVWDSVWNFVWDSLLDSVRGTPYAYIGSLFPNITDWKYIDHEEGVYPFQPAVDLLKMGFVPSFDGTVWRLHSGENAQIVFERK